MQVAAHRAVESAQRRLGGHARSSYPLASRVVLFAVVMVVSNAHAHYMYTKALPNADLVVDDFGKPTPAIGHVNMYTGGGTTNQFGKDFKNHQKTWTVALCQLDSDGDGLSNGLELGDPDCVWTPGAVPAFTMGISNPGVSNKRVVTGSPVPSVAPVTASTDAPTTAVGDGVPTWVVAHAVFMAIGAGVVLPVAACIPVLGRHRSVWRDAHLGAAIAALLLVGVGLVLALVNLDDVGPHGALGLVAAMLLVVQVFAALLYMTPPVRRAHKWLGRALIVLVASVMQTGYAHLNEYVNSRALVVWSWVHPIVVICCFGVLVAVKHVARSAFGFSRLQSSDLASSTLPSNKVVTADQPVAVEGCVESDQVDEPGHPADKQQLGVV